MYDHDAKENVRKYKVTKRGRKEGTKIGRYEGWKVQRLEGTKVGRYDGTKVGRYEGWRVRRYEGMKKGSCITYEFCITYEGTNFGLYHFRTYCNLVRRL